MSGTPTRDIVQRLWGLCNILRDDGITYQAYVTELTYLLFLKMLQETERESTLPAGFRWGDLTRREGEALGQADLILTNPPFGTKKGGGRPTRANFTITADTSNKQLAFVEHVVRALKPGGRAGVVVPDNVLFADGAGRELRGWLMELCDLHTILRLPTGIFYAQGVKTNVLFFTRGQRDRGTTKAVWVYDLRAGQPAYGKTRPLRVEDFASFGAAYGDDPNGAAARTEEGPEGRFRRFSREEVRARADNLDIAWLRSGDEAAEDALEEPEDIAESIRVHLQRALVEIEGLVGELGNGTALPEAAE